MACGPGQETGAQLYRRQGHVQIHSVHLPSVSLLPYTVHPESSQHLNVPHLAILHLYSKKELN